MAANVFFFCVWHDWDTSGRDRTWVGSATESGVAMFDELNRLPLEYERDLDAWTCVW